MAQLDAGLYEGVDPIDFVLRNRFGNHRVLYL